MTQQHTSNSTTSPVSSQAIATASAQMIMADSVEVMEYYYRGKIQELEQSLSLLNLLEHAREISRLCKEIIRTKGILKNIIIKKANQSRAPFSFE